MAVALPVIAVALTAIGTGVAAYSAVEQGKAADEASKRQQEAENANSKQAQDAAALEAAQVRRRNLLRMGSQRASAAKSGVLIDDSAADVIYDTAIQGELEALSATYSGAAASSYYRSRGVSARAEGRAARRAGNLGAGATLIGGLAKGANQYPTLR